MENILKRINDAINKNTLTFFVGAGVSRLSNIPKWSELIDKFCAEINYPIKKQYSNDEYLSIPQKYFYSINCDKEKYYYFVNSILSINNSKTNLIHKLMCVIKPQSFITTNFDNLIEDAVIQNCLTYKCIVSDREIPEINGDKFILKIHGDLIHKNIVLKEEDYLNYSENFKLIETFLKSIFATNTVVFIGYSLNDYNIKLILNWTKTLLGDSFNKPIFIYTDNNPLNEIELKYYESKGLSILDYKYFLTDDKTINIEYEKRYELVLNKIISTNKNDISEMDEYQHFCLLYNLLNPLNKFKTLKPVHIHRQLSDFVIVDEDACIFINPDKPNIFKLFCKYNKNESLLTNEKEDFMAKYKIISEILIKAIIYNYRVDGDLFKFNFPECKFADENCISFNYINMYKQSKKSSKSIHVKYRNAFYLAKIKKYTEAFNLFKEIAKESYIKQDFLLYYLAQINKIRE